MSEDRPSTEALVSAYIKMRTAIEEKEEQHKTEIAALKEDFDAVAAELLGICNELNADSIKTPVGTISRRVSSRYWTSDWQSMYEFIKEHNALHLLEQRIHNGNMKQFLDENPEELPIGLQADRKYTVQVRRPTAK